MDNGELKTMDIVAYTDNTFQVATGDKYSVLVNPENYSLEYSTAFNQKSAQGSSESVSAFNRRNPQHLAFKFIFDGSGAIPGAGTGNIVEDFGSFKNVVYSYNSDTHQPGYVQLRWGVLIYNCRLTAMKMNFTLFKPDGTPIRATADCTFQGYIDDKKLAAIENRMSPDLTHIRTVISGDTLPLLCSREYGDSKYYYGIAQYMAANYDTLIDFKQLKPGATLYFPPLTESKNAI